MLLGLYGSYGLSALTHDMIGTTQLNNQLYMLLGAVEGARLRAVGAEGHVSGAAS